MLDKVKKTLELMRLADKVYESKSDISVKEQIANLKDIVTLSAYVDSNFTSILVETYKDVSWEALDSLKKHVNMTVSSFGVPTNLISYQNSMIKTIKNLEETGSLGLFPYIMNKTLSKSFNSEEVESKYNQLMNGLLQFPLGLNKKDKELIRFLIKPNISGLINGYQTESYDKFYGEINGLKERYENDLIETVKKNNESNNPSQLRVNSKTDNDNHTQNGKESIKEINDIMLDELYISYSDALKLSALEQITFSKQLNKENAEVKSNLTKKEEDMLINRAVEIDLLKSKYRNEERNIKTVRKDKIPFNYLDIKEPQERLYASILNNDLDMVQELLLNTKNKEKIDLHKDNDWALSLAKKMYETKGFNTVYSFLGKYVENENKPIDLLKLNKIRINEAELSSDELKSLLEMTMVCAYKSTPNKDVYSLLEIFSTQNLIPLEEVISISDNLPTVSGQITVKEYVDNLSPGLKPKSIDNLESLNKKKLK